MLILSEADISAVLSMRDVIDAMERALRAQASGDVRQPLRLVTRPPVGYFGAMPAWVQGAGLGAKLVSFFPDNAARGIHTHHALIALFDDATGKPTAVLDGRLITEMRTAATSAVASKYLANGPGAVAMLGTGVQARSHVRALREAGLLEQLRVWGRSPDHAQSFAQWAQTEDVDASVASSVAEACRGAAIVCTVTAAREPILGRDAIALGTHINAVGSSAPAMRELTSDLLAQCRIVVDTVEGATTEAGEIVAAMADGTLPASPSLTRLCDIASGSARGRRSHDEITLFKSLGMAIEDVACASIAVDRALERDLGTMVDG